MEKNNKMKYALGALAAGVFAAGFTYYKRRRGFEAVAGDSPQPTSDRIYDGTRETWAQSGNSRTSWDNTHQNVQH